MPQDIYQTGKVAKVLLLLEKGKGHQFHGKNINEIELKDDVYYSSESENDDDGNMPLSDRVLSRLSKKSVSERSPNDYDLNLPSTSQVSEIDRTFQGVNEKATFEEDNSENGNSVKVKRKASKKKDPGKGYLENAMFLFF